MTADRSVMERRLQAAFAESPTVAGAAMLDGRMSAAIAAGVRPRGAGAGSTGRRRTPWMLPAAAVVALAVAGGGGLAWLSGRTAVPAPGSTAPVGAVLPSPSAAPSVFPTATPQRIVITPPPASPEPLPVMEARAAVDLLERSSSPLSSWWWSPGRRLGRFGRTGDRAGGVVALGAYPPANAEVVLDPRPDGIVRISSMGATDGTADPLGCEPGSFGRYRIAATEERLDLLLVADPCPARVAAVEGTWQATLRLGRPSMLFELDGNAQVEAFRLDLVAAAASKESGMQFITDARDATPEGSTPRRGLWFERPDAAVVVGVPTGAALGACTLDPDPVNDVTLRSAEEAIADLRARPGVDVSSTAELAGTSGMLHRVDVAVTDTQGACPSRTLFAAAPKVQSDSLPLWQVPMPAPGEATAPIYLATVPGRDGATAAVAILVEPTVDGSDLDTIAAQVFGAIDWEPGLHPPAWPAGD